mgnify:CR=1 FL=1
MSKKIWVVHCEQCGDIQCKSMEQQVAVAHNCQLKKHDIWMTLGHE